MGKKHLKITVYQFFGSKNWGHLWAIVAKNADQ